MKRWIPMLLAVCLLTGCAGKPAENPDKSSGLFPSFLLQ